MIITYSQKVQKKAIKSKTMKLPQPILIYHNILHCKFAENQWNGFNFWFRRWTYIQTIQCLVWYEIYKKSNYFEIYFQSIQLMFWHKRYNNLKAFPLWNLAAVKNYFSLSKIWDIISLALLNSSPDDESGDGETLEGHWRQKLLKKVGIWCVSPGFVIDFLFDD